MEKKKHSHARIAKAVLVLTKLSRGSRVMRLDFLKPKSH